jgi:hypothetical protein
MCGRLHLFSKWCRRNNKKEEEKEVEGHQHFWISAEELGIFFFSLS